MLQMLHRHTPKPLNTVKVPAPARPHVNISVTTISRLAPALRATLAAQFTRGEVTIKPTAALAVRLFRSYPAAVRAANAKLRKSNSAPEPRINHIWDAMSPEEHATFVKNHLGQIWRLVDQATAA